MPDRNLRQQHRAKRIRNRYPAQSHRARSVQVIQAQAVQPGHRQISLNMLALLFRQHHPHTVFFAEAPALVIVYLQNRRFEPARLDHDIKVNKQPDAGPVAEGRMGKGKKRGQAQRNKPGITTVLHSGKAPVYFGKIGPHTGQ